MIRPAVLYVNGVNVQDSCAAGAGSGPVDLSPHTRIMISPADGGSNLESSKALL